jgi:hypothetical protein
MGRIIPKCLKPPTSILSLSYNYVPIIIVSPKKIFHYCWSPMIVGDTNATKVAMCIGPFQEPPQAENQRLASKIRFLRKIVWHGISIDIVWLATLYICSNHTSTGCMWLCISAVYIYSNLQVVSPHLPALHQKNWKKWMEGCDLSHPNIKHPVGWNDSSDHE